MDRRLLENMIIDLFNACNSHNTEKIGSFFSEDFVGLDITYARKICGKTELVTGMKDYLEAFRDVSLKLNKMIIDKDKVAVLWTATGTHNGSLWKIPPSFRNFNIQGTWMLEISGNQISTGTGIWDLSGFLRRINLMPNLPHEKHSAPQN